MRNCKQWLHVLARESRIVDDSAGLSRISARQNTVRDRVTHNPEFLHFNDPLLRRGEFLIGNNNLPGNLIGRIPGPTTLALPDSRHVLVFYPVTSGLSSFDQSIDLGRLSSCLDSNTLAHRFRVR
jgi:hypothetical protein